MERIGHIFAHFLWQKRCFTIAFLFIAICCNGQYRWQIGGDAHLLLNKYTALDPTATLRSIIYVPTGSGNVVIERALKPRGLYIVSGLGYRQIGAAYGLLNERESTSFNGIGVWSVPVLLRQDLTLLLATWRRSYRVSAVAGLVNEFTSAEGLGGLFSETNNNVTLTGQATLVNHYSVTGCIGAEIRFPIIRGRLDGLVHQYYYVGFKELAHSTIDITKAGQTQQATVRNLGSGYTPLGVGLRYHMYWGSAGQPESFQPH